MNEIEKMYNNANLTSLYCGDDYVASSGLEFECTDGNKEKCKTCDKVKTNYPQFTAEKQIAILQLLTQQCDLTISHFREWEFIHYDGQEPLQITGKDFTETFAKLINVYWQDLTEEEKASIKNILEM